MKKENNSQPYLTGWACMFIEQDGKIL